ncbi:hypothetical protein [Clostridium botulinum]|uniref:hypothetical protein n=1 Tax=Clostridium botulinum TaxID=1491 RepID=UPI001C9AC213|nr:hypothetical protein [Clostridium botulinum]MBY6810792.1 hypothetical protein [Clostridium botulinum]MBY6824213.1 hypothetical protein [Clostridium botulinum]MBY6834667.1 hypothetical protein [Clostridium botulinum]MBY6973379.1 hypothetical protein [Clostridium botulinum]MCS6104395.1 hypothetical protein [Clostridium botulinum]
MDKNIEKDISKNGENNKNQENSKAIKSIYKEKSDINKGYLLEYRIRRLLYYMGYFVKGGVLIKSQIENESDDITDLDVLGILITKNFSSNNIWADCKSGKAKPLERITWINGMRTYIKIDEIMFVKKNIRLSTKEFARNHDIQILDTEIIDNLEKMYCIDIDDCQGTWDYRCEVKAIKSFQEIDIYNKESIKKILDFIRSSYWALDNYRKVKKSITAMKQLGDIIKLPISDEQMFGVKWAIYEIVTLFLLATLNICKEIYCLDDYNKKSILNKNLSSGSLTERQREEVVNASYRLAYSIIKSQNPDFNEKISMPKYESKPPIYFEAYSDLILRITNNPLKFYDVLRFLDIILLEYDLKSKGFDKIEVEKIFNNSNDLLDSSKLILHFICSITNLPREIFQLISK